MTRVQSKRSTARMVMGRRNYSIRTFDINVMIEDPVFSIFLLEKGVDEGYIY